MYVPLYMYYVYAEHYVVYRVRVCASLQQEGHDIQMTIQNCLAQGRFAVLQTHRRCLESRNE